MYLPAHKLAFMCNTYILRIHKCVYDLAIYKMNFESFSVNLILGVDFILYIENILPVQFKSKNGVPLFMEVGTRMSRMCSIYIYKLPSDRYVKDRYATI